jgi:hypothetical protein
VVLLGTSGTSKDVRTTALDISRAAPRRPRGASSARLGPGLAPEAQPGCANVTAAES